MKLAAISMLAFMGLASSLTLSNAPPKDNIVLDVDLKSEITRPPIPGRTINTGMKIVHLQSLPESAFRVGNWPGATRARTAHAPSGGISSAGGTAYVSWRWHDASRNDPPCPNPGHVPDTVDLSVPRSHGFRLHSFLQEPLPAPAGFVHNGWRMRLGDRYFDGAGKPSSELNAAMTIKVSTFLDGAYFIKLPPGPPKPCFTGYRLNISLIGPADVHPFTGQKIVQSPVN